MTAGELKYGAQNWRGGLRFSRVLDASLRHICAFNGGERRDPETGLSHLAHAMANLMMLVEYEITNSGEDDLWKK